MPLAAGDRLGPYEILASIGKGGMGEVYRARDTRLGREVAIKISAEQFSERFEREAKAVAALNHPNICSLFDVGPNFIVMELVEGHTLAERIAEGPMPLEEALHVAAQIADALQTAHDNAIVHRDLKPGNVKIKPDGVVKVLDFGLAKVGAPAAASQSENSPTLSMAATQAGMILGTAGYMSPEQARGKPVDKRADIWAFGVVLYEMVTGQRLFEGEDVVETLAAVVHKEPDWKLAPSRMRSVLQRCLVKDPRKRLRDISGVALLLEQPGETQAPRRLKPALQWAGWVAAAAAATGAILVWAPWRTPSVPELVRFQIPLPEKVTFSASQPVLSPDGKKLAFIASAGTPMVWVRPLDTLEARPLPGTEGAAAALFWSPDSRSIAYWNPPAPFKLKRVEVAGGPPQTLCETPGDPASGAWSPDGVIIFHNRGLVRVPAGGGGCTPLTTLDATRDSAHRFPSFLPDGRHFVYLRESGKPENAGIYIGSLDDKPEQQSNKRVLAADSRAVYASVPGSKTGYLLFHREGTLMAQPFDAGKLELAGDAVPVAEQVGGGNNAVGGFFSASATGALAYRTGPAGGVGTLQLTIFDRQGKVTGTVGEQGNYTEPAFAPDGTQLAFVRFDGAASSSGDIWLHEFARGVSTRFTFDPAEDRMPVWSPDGKQIIFSSERGGGRNLYRKVATGAGTEELLLKSSVPKFPDDWSRDGRLLLFGVQDPKTVEDIWVLPAVQSAASPREPEAYLKTEFREARAKFSPDGRFIAYESDSSGRLEVYVQTFPDPRGGRWQVSKGGGGYPHWRRDGKELFYRTAGSGGTLMAVEISLSPAFKAGIPKMLFQFPVGNNPWDMTADGQKFVKAVQATAVASGARPEPITVVLNWAAGLRK